MPVMWVIGELGLEHIRHDVGGSFGGLDTDAYAQLNPNRKVPTLKDVSLVLWESNAIVRYLCRQYGSGTLWPTDAHKLALADQWMEWQKSTVLPKFFPIFWGLVRTPAEQRDTADIAQRVESTGQLLSILDACLRSHLFVASDTLTMGDIPLGTLIHRYFNLDIERPPLPNVENWYARLCDRPAYQKHVMIPFGSSPEEWLELERAGADG